MLQKIDLLDLFEFVDNEYLDLYITLVNTQSTIYEKFKTSNHHIIPVSYYKLNNLSVNNSVTNIVCLTHYNHILAHYYLILCTEGRLREKMIFAFNFMINEHNKYSVPQSESVVYIERLAQLREDFCKLCSQNSTGHISSLESRKKAKDTFFKHYGVNSPSQLPGVGNKISASKKGICTLSKEQLKEIGRRNGERRLGTTLSDTHKNKIKQSLMGHLVSEETRLKISKKCKGHIPPNKGKICVHNYETQYLNLDNITYEELINYVNKNHLYLGSYVPNNKKKNRALCFYMNKSRQQLHNISLKYNQTREERE